MSVRRTGPALALLRPQAAAQAASLMRFCAAQRGSVFELDIYDVVDPIGENPLFGTKAVSAADVRRKLKQAGAVDTIQVRINSVGGDVFDGTAIYNLLKDHPATVNVHVDGICASIASIIAMAGDTIVMGQGTWMMIHCPYSQYMVDARSDDLRRAADTLDSMRDSMAAVYAERTGLDAKAIVKMMEAETWMTADEALEAGFCTAVGSEQIDPTQTDDSLYPYPAALTAMVAAVQRGCPHIPAGALQAMKKAHTYYAIAANLPAAPVAPTSAIVAADDADDKKKMKQLQEDKQMLQDEVQELKKKLKKAEDDAAKAKAKKDEEDEAARAAAAKAADDEDDPDEEEEDSSAADDKKSKKGKARSEALALAKLGITARAITGAANLVEAEKKIVAMAGQLDKVADIERKMQVIQVERHQARVSDMIAKGLLRPERKEWALAASADQLDVYLQGTGGQAVGPVGVEHHEDPKVVAQLPNAPTGPKPRIEGPVTKEERIAAKALGLTDEQILQARTFEVKNPRALPA